MRLTREQAKVITQSFEIFDTMVGTNLCGKNSNGLFYVILDKNDLPPNIKKQFYLFRYIKAFSNGLDIQFKDQTIFDTTMFSLDYDSKKLLTKVDVTVNDVWQLENPNMFVKIIRNDNGRYLGLLTDTKCGSNQYVIIRFDYKVQEYTVYDVLLDSLDIEFGTHKTYLKNLRLTKYIGTKLPKGI